MTAGEERSAQPVAKALNPVFVVGNPRSGTTLVQQILSVHADFWTAPETHLFDHVLHAAPDATTNSITTETLHTLLNRLSKRSSLTISEEILRELVKQADGGALTGPRFVDLVMGSFKQADDPATRWVEKTPQHLRYLNKIWQYFPDARVVNIVRDARDVVSSPSRFRKHAPGIGRIYAVVNIARRWNRFIALADRYAGDPRFLSIRYEDLVSDPERILEQLAAHTGVEKDKTAIERFHEQFEQVTLAKAATESRAIAEAENKAFNSATGLVDRRSVWKKRLTEQEARIVETICGTRMAQHGYQKEYPPSVQASVQIAAISAIKRMKRTARSLRSLARKVYKPSRPRR